MVNSCSGLHVSFLWYPGGTILGVCSEDQMSLLDHTPLKVCQLQHSPFQGDRRRQMNNKRVSSTILQFSHFLFYLGFFELNMNETNFWSVIRWKCLLIRYCFHFLKASTMAHASFSMAVCLRSDFKSVLEKKATGRPCCLKEAAIAESDASVSTISRAEGLMAAMAELAKSLFKFWNALMTESDNGKVLTWVSKRIFSEKDATHWA